MLLIHQDVKIDDGDGAARNKNADFTRTVEIQARECHKSTLPVKKVREVKTYCRLVEPVQHVHPGISHYWERELPKFGRAPFFAQNASHVKLRDCHGDISGNVLIECSHENNWQGCKDEIDEQNVTVIVEIRSLPIIVNLVPE